MADNRRTSTRHEVDIAARIKVGAEPEDCRIGNLSMGGAFMMMRRLPMGERVTVYFRLPTHDSEIEAVGTIRWSTDQGVGVQFEPVLEILRRRLQHGEGRLTGFLDHRIEILR